MTVSKKFYFSEVLFFSLLANRAGLTSQTEGWKAG